MSSAYYSGKVEMKPEIDEQKNTNLSSFEVYPFKIPRICLVGCGEEYFPQIDFSWDDDSIVMIREKSIVKYTQVTFCELLAKDEKGDIVWIDGRTAPYSDCWDGEYLGETRMAQEYAIEEYCLNTLEKKKYKMVVEDVSPMSGGDRSRLAEFIDMKEHGLDFYIQDEKLLGYYGKETNLVIPEDVKEIADEALRRREFDSLTIPKSLVKMSASSMVGCKVKKLFVAEDNPKYYVENDMLIDRETATIVWGYGGDEIPIDGSVEKIGKSAFLDRRDIEKLVIPDTITEIGEWAFGGCHNLKEIVIPESIKVIGKHAFGDCPSLAKGKVPDRFLVDEAQRFDAELTKSEDGTVLFKERGRTFPSNGFYF